MQAYPGIKRFVQGVLGCSCPEEVFDNIGYQVDRDGISARKVTVGDRLLIYLVNMNGTSGIQGVIDSALQQGVGEREKKGFNRFRLVLVASCPDGLRNAAEQAYDSSGYADEKTHLHVVNETDVECF